MAKMNYNRKNGSSLVPRFTRQSESERQERIIERLGKAKYFKDQKMNRMRAADVSADSWFESADYVERKREVKRKTDRLQLIKAIAEGKPID